MKHAVYDEIGGEEDSGNALEDDVSEEATRRGSSKSFVGDQDSADPFLANIHCHVDEPFSLDEVRMVKCTSIDKISATATDSTQATSGEQPVVADCESGEMELFIEKRFDRWALSQETAVNTTKTVKFYYDELFVGESAKVASPKRSIEEDDAVERNEGEGADLDIAMTLHQIGQIHRRSHRHAAALSAYNAALRGMKHVFGCDHAHTAAILGNIGNLYMETGDYDEAFAIYQEVLGIETLHLGLSHPEVSVSLHNIATIESSRGNFSEAVSLYKQVAEMQKIRFGQNHITVAITLGCLADAYERMGNLENAMKTYEEALKIRTLTLTKYHIDVGRLMHKLGRLASSRKDYATAMNHVKKAIEIYAINVLPSDHLFMKEMARDYADIQAGLAFESTWIPYLNDNIDSVCDC
jgi:tetratricopeptide (TPR) repeat protein